MIDDPAERIMAGLTGTPEHVGNYLNSSAADDIRALMEDCKRARARYHTARLERMAAEARLARMEKEVARLRAWVGYR